MPRKLRIEYPGAIYHVMSRGNRRQDIFLVRHVATGSWPTKNSNYRPNVETYVTVDANTAPTFFTHKLGANLSLKSPTVLPASDRQYPQADARVLKCQWTVGSAASVLISSDPTFAAGINGFVQGLTSQAISSAYNAASGGSTRTVVFSAANIGFNLGFITGIGLGQAGGTGSITLQITRSGSSYSISGTAAATVTVSDFFDYNYFQPGDIINWTSVSRDGATLQSGFGKSGGGNAGEVMYIEIAVNNSAVPVTPRAVTYP